MSLITTCSVKLVSSKASPFIGILYLSAAAAEKRLLLIYFPVHNRSAESQLRKVV